MTYWVIARFSDGIYMAADIRASTAVPSALAAVPRQGGPDCRNRSYGDYSKKLFTARYTTNNRVPVAVGLCTSGYESYPGTEWPSIANILNDFFLDIQNQKMSFSNGIKFIEGLLDFIKNNYKPDVASYVINNTQFGVGIIIGNVSYIASWRVVEGHCLIETHDERGYLESTFIEVCRNNYIGKMGRHLFGQSFGFEAMRPYELYVPSGIDFVRNIITIAARSGLVDPNAAQMISYDVQDAAYIGVNNVIYYPGEKNLSGQMQTPFTHGSDRVSIPDVTYGTPAASIDIEDQLRKGRPTRNKPR